MRLDLTILALCGCLVVPSAALVGVGGVRPHRSCSARWARAPIRMGSARKNHGDGGSGVEVLSAAALPVPSRALEAARPMRPHLRQVALTNLEQLAAPAADALRRERRLLAAERDLVVSAAFAVVAALVCLRQRVLRPNGALATLSLFCAARLAAAFAAASPDPRELVPWPRAARAALRWASLSLEAVGLGLLSVALACAAASAAIELGIRTLCARLAAAYADGDSLWHALVPSAGVLDSLELPTSPAALKAALGGARRRVASNLKEWSAARRAAAAVAAAAAVGSFARRRGWRGPAGNPA